MNKRILLAVFLSTWFLILWSTIFHKPLTKPTQKPKEPEKTKEIVEKHILWENKEIKIIFSEDNAAISGFFIKETKEEKMWPSLIVEQNILSCPLMSYTSKIQNNKILFSAEMEGIHLTKTYELQNNYLFQLSYKLKNKTNDKQKYELRLNLPKCLGGDIQQKELFIRESKPIFYNITKKIPVAKLPQGIYPIEKLNPKWLGIDNRYFLFAIIPFTQSQITLKKNKTGFDYSLTTTVELNPNEEKEISTKFYLGPKKASILKIHNLGLEKTINYGLFAPISQLALAIMKISYSIVPNYGFSIIMLSIVSQILLLPLSIKSLKSMKKLRDLQPKIQLLQRAYQSDPKRLQQEIMNLYKAHKLNPFGGCLLMLPQLPIFFALFSVINNTYDLRKAPFILWIKDLSVKDPYYVLPILMGIFTFIQQRLTQTTADPSQKIFSYMMPVIFTIIFLNFSSGLVLYWLTNSLITAIQHAIMYKKI